MELVDKKNLLNELKNQVMENQAIDTNELNLTSDKPNIGLESIIQLLENKGVVLESTLQLYEVIEETNNQYSKINIEISQLKRELEPKIYDLNNYKLILKNYENFFQNSKTKQFHEFNNLIR